jgi:hypothetical protein
LEQLPHLKPLAALYRVARTPDPWAPPDWAFAADGEPVNRYDDPERYYRVLYAGTSRYACFVETLACFRLNIQLYADLNAIEGEDDYLPLGSVPATWSRTRCVGRANVGGIFADVLHSGWIAHLRVRLAGTCVRLGLPDLDAAALRMSAPRTFTQAVSRLIYDAARYAGIRYVSKFGDDLENWAIFEPFSLQVYEGATIASDDADLLRALDLHKLRMR